MSSNLSTEKLLETVRKKRACNARARQIVEDLLERHIEAVDFLSKILFIDQNHYEDIINERHILHFCGYPLCSEENNNIPRNQYRISTVTNKVYDITEKKKFCSAKCFKSSEYIKSQILTTPLWMRDPATEYEFRLLD